MGCIMEIILEYKETKLIKKYGLYYIRFSGGRMADIPCDLKISKDEIKIIKDSPEKIKEVRDLYKKKVPWTEEYFVNSALEDYFCYELEFSDKKIKSNMEKLDRHKDIKFELFETITNDSFPKASAINVCGYTAKKLKEETKLSILGVYNYLIYRREDEENALKDLEKGLPVK